jgi:hypothetical protein
MIEKIAVIQEVRRRWRGAEICTRNSMRRLRADVDRRTPRPCRGAADNEVYAAGREPDGPGCTVIVRERESGHDDCSLPVHPTLRPPPEMTADIDPEPGNLRRVDSRSRTIVSDDGRRWTVRELPASQYDRRGPSLVFVNDDVMRRVRTYPGNWFDLDDVALFALSLGH